MNSKFICILGALVLTAPLHAEEKSKSLHDQFTGQGYGTAGCGLGSVVFGDKKGMVQVFAATTNGTAGNQTFAISSGTSNCESASASASVRTEFFVAQNDVSLKNDIARGNGETVTGLARVMNCKDEARVAQTLQSHFSTIYTSATAPARVVTQSIVQTLKSDSLAGCQA